MFSLSTFVTGTKIRHAFLTHLQISIGFTPLPPNLQKFFYSSFQNINHIFTLVHDTSAGKQVCEMKSKGTVSKD